MDSFRNKVPRRAPILLAVLLSGWLVVSFESTEHERWKSPAGDLDLHRELNCDQCHQSADGTARQQLQANLKHWLGIREHGVDWVTSAISNSDCLDCHRNQVDPHAPHLFLEPKFEETRNNIHPEICTSCHAEHNGAISTIGNTYCFHCHQNIDLAVDPAEPTHQYLVQNEKWESCLRCHDYHDNHVEKTPRKLSDAPVLLRIQEYLEGKSESPYGNIKNPYLEKRGVPR
ncbi:MAG: hypothetical protein AAEJ04_02965 [Planctomycetota bacterium]